MSNVKSDPLGEFEKWATENLARIRNDASRKNIEIFLRAALLRITALPRYSVHQLTFALNDAFLDAKISIRDAPWLGRATRSMMGFDYLEVHPAGFDKPCAARI